MNIRRIRSFFRSLIIPRFLRLRHEGIDWLVFFASTVSAHGYRRRRNGSRAQKKRNTKRTNAARFVNCRLPHLSSLIEIEFLLAGHTCGLILAICLLLSRPVKTFQLLTDSIDFSLSIFSRRCRSPSFLGFNSSLLRSCTRARANIPTRRF